MSKVSSNFKTNNGKAVLVKLSRGDSIIDSLTAIAEELQFNCASITGIGAVENPTLGYYIPEQTQYQFKTFSDGLYELITLNGNITKDKDEYKTHIHVALANKNYEVIAGHLKDATVAVKAEIVITPYVYLNENGAS